MPNLMCRWNSPFSGYDFILRKLRWQQCWWHRTVECAPFLSPVGFHELGLVLVVVAFCCLLLVVCWSLTSLPFFSVSSWEALLLLGILCGSTRSPYLLVILFILWSSVHQPLDHLSKLPTFLNPPASIHSQSPGLPCPFIQLFSAFRLASFQSASC